MKTLLIFSGIVISTLCCAQDKVKGYVELSQKLHTRIYTESNLSLGVLIPFRYGNITILGSYEYGGNFKTKAIPKYQFDYHFLGGGIKYRILKEEKIYSPTIQITAFTEITSNYRGGYMQGSKYDYGFYFQPTHRYYEPYSSSTTYPKGSVREVFYYVSSPFTGSVSIGNEFRIYKTLYANVGIGFTRRGVKVRYKKWFAWKEEPIANISNRYSLKDLHWVNMLDLSFGLNYTFSFNKKSKMEKP